MERSGHSVFENMLAYAYCKGYQDFGPGLRQKLEKLFPNIYFLLKITIAAARYCNNSG